MNDLIKSIFVLKPSAKKRLEVVQRYLRIKYKLYISLELLNRRL